MGDMDARTWRAIEQSAEAEAASLLTKLRSMAAADRVADGDRGRPDAGHSGGSLDASRESHELQSEAVLRRNPGAVTPRKP